MNGKILQLKQKNSLRVCVLIDVWNPVWGGGQTHVWELSKRLVKKKNCVINIYTRALSTSRKRFVVNEFFENGKLTIFRIGPCTRFFNFFGRIAWLIAVFFAVTQNHKKNSYDIIHAHAYLSGLPGKLLSMFLGIPVIFTVHGSNNLDLNKKGIVPFVEKILLTNIHYTKQISVTKHFLKYKNVNKDISIIPNGVNIDFFDKVSKRKRTDKLFKILWVGRFDKVKGLDILLHAFKSFNEKAKNSRLLLVGNGQEEKNIKCLANKLKIRNLITFTGRKKGKSLVRLYKSSDVFVLPSLSEGFPITILESWASNKPVIVTDVGDIKELIMKTKAGYIIPSKNQEALYKALDTIYKQSFFERSQMGRRGYIMVQNQFSWEKIVAQLYTIYEKIAL